MHALYTIEGSKAVLQARRVGTDGAAAESGVMSPTADTTAAPHTQDLILLEVMKVIHTVLKI